MPDFTTFPTWVNLCIISAGAISVWLAGTRLAVLADEIATRTRLTSAFAGLLLLSFATSLPEIVTTITASVQRNPALATSNLIGGTAMQTAVIAVADGVALRGALTFFSPKPVLLMNAAFVILLLAMVIAVSIVAEPIAPWNVGWRSVVIFLTYLFGMYTART